MRSVFYFGLAGALVMVGLTIVWPSLSSASGTQDRHLSRAVQRVGVKAVIGTVDPLAQTSTPSDTAEATSTPADTPAATPQATQTPLPSGSITVIASQLLDQDVVDGLVVGESLQPLANARVAIPELSIDTPLKADGSLSLTHLPVASGGDARRVTIEITAQNLGSFTYLNVPVLPDRTISLTPALIKDPRVDDLMAEELAAQTRSPGLQNTSPGAAGSGCFSLYDTNAFPPKTIRVWENFSSIVLHHSQDMQVHVVDFKFYVKHVLPIEWDEEHHPKDPESLRAGAMAVKMYGWHRSLHMFGGRSDEASGATCYDVDSSDTFQVFDPYFSLPTTEQAVDDTWPFYAVTSSGDVLEALYLQGSDLDRCLPPPATINGETPGTILSQLGSQNCAVDSGMNWLQILPAYYRSVSWQLVRGPAEPTGMTLLPNTNSTVKLTWTVADQNFLYLYCKDTSFSSSFPFSTCSVVFGSSVTDAIPASEYRYYRVVACNLTGYCAGSHAGGVGVISFGDEKFYGTAYWTYPTARVAGRNIAGTTKGLILSDGASKILPGVQTSVAHRWCRWGIPVGINCGPITWPTSTPIVTVTGYKVSGGAGNHAYLRILPGTLGD